MVDAIDNFITDPDNEENLGEALQQICNLLFESDPVMMGTCQAWIVEYADDIVELLVNQYLDPLEVCTQLQLCP